jgi:conjugal transfer pilin signal peptidase TrbI
MGDVLVAEKKSGWSMPVKMVWTAIVMILVFDFGVHVFSQHFQFYVDTNEQRCIPEHSIYFIVKHPEHIERGSIYAFRAQGMEPFYQDGTHIGKYASAVAGDTVVQNEQGVFVNGSKVREGFVLASKLNHKESDYYKTFVVAPNQIFFTGSAPRSFDSRYWGTAGQDRVIGKAYPIW